MAEPGPCPALMPAGTLGTLPKRNHRSPGLSVPSARAGAFGGSDQLEQFLRIIQPLPEFWAEGLRGNLRGYAYIASQRVGRDELYFVDFDGAVLAAVN